MWYCHSEYVCYSVSILYLWTFVSCDVLHRMLLKKLLLFKHSELKCSYLFIISLFKNILHSILGQTNLNSYKNFTSQNDEMNLILVCRVTRSDYASWKRLYIWKKDWLQWSYLSVLRRIRSKFVLVGCVGVRVRESHVRGISRLLRNIEGKGRGLLAFSSVFFPLTIFIPMGTS